MDSPETQAQKASLRREAAARREAAYRSLPEAGGALAGQLRDHVAFAKGCVVSGYCPLEGEMDVRAALHELHARGHRIGLPVVIGRDRPLVFREWHPGMELIRGDFKVETPPPHAPELAPAALLVPMLAFDAEGYRLGYGGGFYDRSLRDLRARAAGTQGRVIAVGVAYAAQQVARVPRGPYDQPLDWIVTEKSAFAIGGARVEQD